MSQDDQVRRLLHDARHTEPLPTDVAERLDGVLADLRADRPVRATVTDLAAARRRRRTRILLVAAAAVVVVGVGIDQLAGTQQSGDDSSAGGAADSGAAADRVQPEKERDRGHRATEDRPDGTAGEVAPSSDPQALVEGKVRARLTSDSFGAAARRLLPRDADLQRYELDAGALAHRDVGRCAGADWGRGRVVPVRYDGAPAALVYRAPRGDTQVVDLFVCGSDDPVRSITLPAR